MNDGQNLVKEMLGGSQPIFDQTPEFGVYLSSGITDIDEDTLPLKWSIQKRMVSITSKGKGKVTKEKHRKSPFTKADS